MLRTIAGNSCPDATGVVNALAYTMTNPDPCSITTCQVVPRNIAEVSGPDASAAVASKA